MQFATHINVILALDHYLMNDAHVPFCKHLFTISVYMYTCACTPAKPGPSQILALLQDGVNYQQFTYKHLHIYRSINA